MTTRTSRRRFLRSTSVAGIVALAVPYRDRADERSGRDVVAAQQDDGRSPDALLQGNLRRQGYLPDATIPESVEMAWRVDGVNKSNYEAEKSSPVQTPSGALVVSGDTGTVYGITPEGETGWAVGTWPSANGIHGTPAITDGRVFVSAYDGALYAYDWETGDRHWRTEVDDFIGSSPAYFDGTVYCAVEFWGPNGSVVAVDAATGDVEWEATEPTSHPHSSLAMDLEADKLVVGSNDGYLYAWHFEDREFAWKFNTGRPIKGPIALYDGAAFFGSWDHNVYRVGLDSGEAEWDQSFTADYTVMSGPAIDTDSGTVYVGSNDYSLYAIDAETGSESWEYETGGYVLGCPTVTSEHVLFGSGDTNLYVLDKESSELAWNVETSGKVTSTPLVSDDGISFANSASTENSGGIYRLVAAE